MKYTNSFEVRKDGEIKHRCRTENEALIWLQKHTSYSWHHAIKYEGWTVEKVID